tara:strand:- start:3028 stop:3627 length:600 start_codon:yes stop_codon:yes gene_type:complete
MHAFDQERLEHLCGTHDLEDGLLKLYAIAQKLWHTIQTGPMSDEMLMYLVINAKAYSMPEDVVSPWDNVPAYSPVVVSHRDEIPYTAEFVRRKFGADGRDIGQVEIRMFGDDSMLRSEPAEFVKLAERTGVSHDLPDHLQGLQQGDLVGWTVGEQEMTEVRFQGITDDGQIHLKTGKTNSKNNYVPAEEVSVLATAEIG